MKKCIQCGGEMPKAFSNGLKLSPSRIAKRKFCSLKCRLKHDAEKPSMRTPKPEWFWRAVMLYKTGLGSKTILKRIGVDYNSATKGTLIRWLKHLGIFDPKRENRMHLPNHGGDAPSDSLVTRLLMEALKSETFTVSGFDELEHWGNTTNGHPEMVRWYYALNARRQYHRKNKQHDTAWWIKRRMRNAIYHALKVGDYKKFARTFELTGCTPPDLISYIEAQFELGMNWQNYGAHWHIDHIRPLASFDLSKESNQRRAFHFTNLRPLPAEENIRKHANRHPQLERKVKPKESFSVKILS